MSEPAGDDLHRHHVILEAVLIEIRGLAAAVYCIGSVLDLEADEALAPHDALRALGCRIVELARDGAVAIEAALRARRKERGIRLPGDQEAA